METRRIEETAGDVWFVYDGECPICRTAAQALRIRKAVGSLHLVNAREEANHPIMEEIRQLGLDLDAGMVMKFQGRCYHGQDALHLMALLGSRHGWFNRMNAVLFRSRTVAKLCYPLMRATRNGLLRLQGTPPIDNLEESPATPIFAAIFGEDWARLPLVMQRHYAVRAYSDDSVTVRGTLDIEVSWGVRIMARLTGMLVPYAGKNIPVTVTFRSGRHSRAFHFERVFHFPQHGDICFNSRMDPGGGNELVEFMRFGIGWKLAYRWDGEAVRLEHRGYVWRLLGWMIPLPLAWIIGRGNAVEVPLSDATFRMHTSAVHPWFGRTFGYGGEFTVIARELYDDALYASP
jgi:predicted DCC family thiol-disulfide oxidoreductase YuxK